MPNDHRGSCSARGKRLFDGVVGATALTLVEARPLASGTVILTYRRAE